MGRGVDRKDPTHVTPKVKSCMYTLDFIDSKYIWVHGFISQGSRVSIEILFLAFLALHREKKRCGQVEPSPCYFQSEVVYTYQVINL